MSASTMDAPRQKLMNESATVVATTTLAVVEEGLVTSDDIDSRRTALFYAVRFRDVRGRRATIREMPPAAAQTIVAKLAEHGFQAFFVGGCVRDLVLQHEPADWDICTDATPDRLMQLFPGAQLVGAKFGVVMVGSVEVATFRSDFAYRDGRHPEGVRYETDPKQDVLRRDFTINALLMDPATEQVIDYTGGLGDLRAGVIRAIGNPVQRFQEDHLRMLRAVRFA